MAISRRSRQQKRLRWLVDFKPVWLTYSWRARRTISNTKCWSAFCSGSVFSWSAFFSFKTTNKLCFFFSILVSFLLVWVSVNTINQLKFVFSGLISKLIDNFFRLDKLRNKTVWILGCSSGIGEQLAYQLARLHCKLILSATNEEKLIQVKQKCLGQL